MIYQHRGSDSDDSEVRRDEPHYLLALSMSYRMFFVISFDDIVQKYSNGPFSVTYRYSTFHYCVRS